VKRGILTAVSSLKSPVFMRVFVAASGMCVFLCQFRRAIALFWCNSNISLDV